MKFNANSDPATANSTPTQPPTSASVPISIYRELAAELQATHVMLESLNIKNQQLTQQNQQLRLEIERVVHLGLNLRHWVDPSHLVDSSSLNGSREQATSGHQPSRPTPSAAEAAAIAEQLRSGERSSLSDELYTEEGVQLHRSDEVKPAKDFSGLWLTLTILFIVLSAFGAGFLVMKPFLSGGNR